MSIEKYSHWTTHHRWWRRYSYLLAVSYTTITVISLTTSSILLIINHKEALQANYIYHHKGFHVAEHNRQFWFFWLVNHRSKQCLWKEWPHCPFAMWHTMLGSLRRIQWGQIESRDSLQIEQVMETESETQLATAFHLMTEKMGFSTYILILIWISWYKMVLYKLKKMIKKASPAGFEPARVPPADF